MGCDSGWTFIDPKITIPSWSAMIFFDTVIFVLTIVRALRVCKCLFSPATFLMTRYLTHTP